MKYQSTYKNSLQNLWESSPFLINKQHVYSHQDTTGRTMPQLEKFNCRVDELAKDIALYHHQIAPPETIPTLLGFGTIWCSGQIITGKIQQAVYQHISRNRLV